MFDIGILEHIVFTKCNQIMENQQRAIYTFGVGTIISLATVAQKWAKWSICNKSCTHKPVNKLNQKTKKQTYTRYNTYGHEWIERACCNVHQLRATASDPELLRFRAEPDLWKCSPVIVCASPRRCVQRVALVRVFIYKSVCMFVCNSRWRAPLVFVRIPYSFLNSPARANSGWRIVAI